MKTQEYKDLIKNDKYQVFIFACRAHFPFGLAYHPWFVVNKKGVFSRWEIAHYKNNMDWGYLFHNSLPPFQGISVFSFSKKYLREVELIGKIEGDENSTAQKIAEFIEKSKESYPYNHKYILTGPNSNTYIQWVLSSFPEWNLKLPWNFIGKDYKIKK
jgi:hypothetical protein